MLLRLTHPGSWLDPRRATGLGIALVTLLLFATPAALAQELLNAAAPPNETAPLEDTPEDASTDAIPGSRLALLVRPAASNTLRPVDRPPCIALPSRVEPSHSVRSDPFAIGLSPRLRC